MAGSLGDRPWPSRVLPTFTMARPRLVYALLGQYLFVSLYRALAESLASENAARLAAMQAAEKNIEDRLKELSCNTTSCARAPLPKNFWISSPDLKL